MSEQFEPKIPPIDWVISFIEKRVEEALENVVIETLENYSLGEGDEIEKKTIKTIVGEVAAGRI